MHEEEGAAPDSQPYRIEHGAPSEVCLALSLRLIEVLTPEFTGYNVGDVCSAMLNATSRILHIGAEGSEQKRRQLYTAAARYFAYLASAGEA